MSRRTVAEACAAVLALLLIASGHQQPAARPASPQTAATAAPLAVSTATPRPAAAATPPPTPIAASRSTPQPEAVTGLTNPLDAYMQQQVQANSFSGSVLVAHAGTVLLRRGYGPASRELNVPNSPETKFRIGSLTKQFTSLSIMMLQERGKLHVQDSACSYVPNCPLPWHLITLQDLLSHESGLPGSVSSADFLDSIVMNWTPAQWMPAIEKQILQYAPGTKYQYGSLDYIVLSYIIEHLSGQTYGQFLQANIFSPLGMADTGIDPTGLDSGAPILMHRAIGYERIDGVIRQEPFNPVTEWYGAGDLYSTVDDMYRWSQALYTEKLVPKAALIQMFTPRLGGYGYGWEVGQFYDGNAYVRHTGVSAGFRSIIEVVPGDQMVVIALSNLDMDNGILYTIADRLSRQVMKV